jgi:predicted GTPase
LHWTDRDRLAWKRVEERQKVDAIPADKFGEPQFYFDVAQEMARDLAKVYRPDATDPVGLVTVPEILTVVELASHDLNEMVHTYVPGSHLMTVDNWRTARKAVDWYRKATNIYWAASAVLDPIKTATRYFAAKYGIGKPFEQFQQQAIFWFYTAYVRELGFYLIELYSGRLKVGVTRYRELTAQHAHKPGEPGPPPTAAAAAPAEEVKSSAPTPVAPPGSVTICVIGQVKAGKSSLINAVLGERKAATDILPLTNQVTRYDLVSPGVPAHLGLLDTTGYGHMGATADNVQATGEAVQDSDLVLLVAHARNPARKADVEFLARLRDWFANRPHLRFPPMLVVLTHVDLLTPAMEWAPPYDWVAGTRTKERSMSDAVASARESFPDALGIVPCRTNAGGEWGVQEELLPEVVALLGEAKAVALLRCLHAEAEEGKVKKVFSQLWAAGRKALDVFLTGMATR